MIKPEPREQSTSGDRPNKSQELLEAAESAIDWLCDSPIGTDQYERGERLRKAVGRFNLYPRVRNKQ